jgi:hypothetical protein
MKVVKVSGQSYATAAVTIRTSAIDPKLRRNGETDADCKVSWTINAEFPKAHVSACESSSAWEQATDETFIVETT